jgi:hypothetical protein
MMKIMMSGPVVVLVRLASNHQHLVAVKHPAKECFNKNMMVGS